MAFSLIYIAIVQMSDIQRDCALCVYDGISYCREFREISQRSLLEINVKKTLSVSPILRPIMSETSQTAKIIFVLYWAMDSNMTPIISKAPILH